MTANNNIDSLIEKIHPDVKNLMWYKNAKSEQTTLFEMDSVPEANDFKGLIDKDLPIEKPTKKDENVDPPSPNSDYYPYYKKLNTRQRWIFFQYLQNPYTLEYDMKYMLLLYCGLELHLYKGDFEKAFDVIIKLSDAYKIKDGGFQDDSLSALAISSIIRDKKDYAKDYFQKLITEKRFHFYHNTALYVYYEFDFPISADFIVHLAYKFGYEDCISAYDYISEETLEKAMNKKGHLKESDFSPEENFIMIEKKKIIFERNISKILIARYGKSGLLIRNIIDKKMMDNLSTIEPFLANFPSGDNGRSVFKIPLLVSDSKLYNEINDILKTAHDYTRKDVGRKDTVKKLFRGELKDVPIAYNQEV